jgi:phosphate uptake regulator
MHIRKIFKVGGKSYVVTLPKEWVRRLKSPEVAIVYDSVLLIVPKEKTFVLDKVLEEVISEVVRK